MAVSNLFKHWTYKVFAPGTLLRRKYSAFKELLRYDNVCLDLIADLEEIFYGSEFADYSRIVWLTSRLSSGVHHMVEALMTMEPTRYVDLPEYLRKIDFYVRMGLDLPQPDVSPPYVLPLNVCAGRFDVAGGKAANLATAANLSGLPVPPGVVVTTTAYAYFLEANELAESLRRTLSHVVLSRPEELADHCRKAQDAIMTAEVPEVLAAELTAAATDLTRQGQSLALRSSAVSEDGRSSFAGQFSSVLDVSADKAVEAYKRVVASKYSPRAVTYRILNGLADEDIPMAVLVMPMVQAAVAGVMYTCDPDHASGESCGSSQLTLYSVPGQGKSLVDGSLRPEIQRFTRSMAPAPVRSTGIHSGKILSPDAALSLARMGMALEAHFGRPQDVEWAVDKAGGIFILQSRPIAAEMGLDNPTAHVRLQQALPETPALMEGLTRISSGQSCGPVFLADSVIDPAEIPKGVVLLVRNLSPSLVRIIGRVAAVVSQSGSRGSHFASVAREFGMPVLVGEGVDFGRFLPGQPVTVNADHGCILSGCPPALALDEKTSLRGRVPERLEKVIPHIAKLTLTDPDSQDFRPDKARSFHDLIRFIHEKGVAAMFSLVDKTGKGMTGAKKLKSDLPLTMYLLDLGGGLFETAADKSEVTPNDFKSQLLWSLWWGLSDPGVKWSSDLPHMDWEAFDRVSAGIFTSDSKFLASYAVVSEAYLHLMIRFGYHFSVVDAYCSPKPEQNYITFRFKGGGATMDQRMLRLEFIARVLAYFGFSVTTKGDMLDAKCSRKDESDTLKRLAELGYILAITRLMDMGLSDLAQVDEMVATFVRNRIRD